MRLFAIPPLWKANIEQSTSNIERETGAVVGVRCWAFDVDCSAFVLVAFDIPRLVRAEKRTAHGGYRKRQGSLKRGLKSGSGSVSVSGSKSVRESQQHGTWSRSLSRSPGLRQSTPIPIPTPTPRGEKCVGSHDRNAPRRSVRAWRGVEK